MTPHPVHGCRIIYNVCLQVPDASSLVPSPSYLEQAGIQTLVVLTFGKKSLPASSGPLVGRNPPWLEPIQYGLTLLGVGNPRPSADQRFGSLHPSPMELFREMATKGSALIYPATPENVVIVGLSLSHISSHMYTDLVQG